MRIPKAVHAEIVEKVRQEYLGLSNRKERRYIIKQRRDNFRKLPRHVRLSVVESLN